MERERKIGRKVLITEISNQFMRNHNSVLDEKEVNYETEVDSFDIDDYEGKDLLIDRRVELIDRFKEARTSQRSKFTKKRKKRK